MENLLRGSQEGLVYHLGTTQIVRVEVTVLIPCLQIRTSLSVLDLSHSAWGRIALFLSHRPQICFSKDLVHTVSPRASGPALGRQLACWAGGSVACALGNQ